MEHSRCGGILNNNCITNLLLTPKMKEFENQSASGKVRGKSMAPFWLAVTMIFYATLYSRSTIVRTYKLHPRHSWKGQAQPFVWIQECCTTDPCW